MDTYLSKIEETYLPHNLRGMVAQVLIIFIFDDGRNLFKCVLGVLAKEDGVLLNDGHLTCHQPLPLAWLGRQLTSVGGFTNSRPRHHLGFLRWTVHLLRWFSFCGRVSLTRHFRQEAPLLFFPSSCLLLNIGSPPLLHIDGRIKKKKSKHWATDLRLQTFLSYRQAASVGSELAIPMQGDKLGPRPLGQIGSSKNLLQEASLLKYDFWTILSCNRRRLE